MRGHKEGEAYTQAKELGPPPLEFAKTAGRMNAPGIVVFYGAYDKDTALAEATGTHDSMTVAEFETLSDLAVVDLTNLPRIPSIFERGLRDSLLFLEHFTQEVSRPFEPDAEIHIEYTPTQVVSEFFRHRLTDRNDSSGGGSFMKVPNGRLHAMSPSSLHPPTWRAWRQTNGSRRNPSCAWFRWKR